MFEQAKTTRAVSGSGGDANEPGPGGSDESRRKLTVEADERLAHRRDIEMIGVLTERLTNSERRNSEARRKADEAAARLKVEQDAHKLAVERIGQLEKEHQYLRAECEVLRAAAQRTFYAGSSSVYLNLGLIDKFERETWEKQARRERIEHRIRRFVPRRLRKYVRRVIFGKS